MLLKIHNALKKEKIYMKLFVGIEKWTKDDLITFICGWD